jgi:hypothetical protein
MEFTHCGEVGGEPFAVSCLKLLPYSLQGQKCALSR